MLLTKDPQFTEFIIILQSKSSNFPLNSYMDEGEINKLFLNFFALTSQSKLGSPPLSTSLYSWQRLSYALRSHGRQTYLVYIGY